jgi:hypothetical protein
MAARKTTNRKTKTKNATTETPKSKTTTRSTRTAGAAEATPARTTTRRKTTASQTTEIKTSHDDIARRAYERWLEEGCPEGRDEAHWYDAINELTGEKR